MKTEDQKEHQHIVCPRCGLKEFVEKDTKSRRNGLIIIKYQCKKCDFKFTPKQSEIVQTRGKKHQTGRTSVDLDKAREAKKPGKRIVKHVGKDGKVTESVYYEFRRNRSDIDPSKRL